MTYRGIDDGQAGELLLADEDENSDEKDVRATVTSEIT